MKRRVTSLAEKIEPIPAAPAAVFVLDADEAVRAGLRALLASHGYLVETFDSAEEFLQRYSGRQRGLLITDVDLPGMSGLDLLDHLRAQGFGIPVIVLASDGSVPMTVRAMRSGASDFLEKPFFQSALLRRVGELLR